MRHYGPHEDDPKKEKLFLELPKATQECLRKLHRRQEVYQTARVNESLLVDIVNTAKVFAVKYGMRLEDVQLDSYIYDDYGSNVSEIEMYVRSPETDQQYHSRLWNLYEAQLAQEKRERAEFERLKAKFQ